MISFISWFEIINEIFIPDPKSFLWIAESVADVATVNPNGIKMLLAKGLSTFLIKGKPIFSNGSKILPKNPSNWTISCKWVFDNFISAAEPFAKDLQNFEKRVLDNNNLRGKLV